MEVPKLKAESRTDLGSKYSRNLRKTGRLPGIIYGHGETPLPFSVLAHDVAMQVRPGVRIVALDLGGNTKQYLIKAVQYDHLDRDPIHIDLARVDMNERVQLRVGVELRGAPVGLSEGGILDQLQDAIEVDCLVSDIPGTLHPSVAHLAIGDALLVKDLELPPGVTVITDGEEKIALVHVLAAKAADGEEAEEEGEAGGSNEPERIGRVAPPEDEKKDSK